MLKLAAIKIWKWAAFIFWLPWFFITLYWQLKKGYAQFVRATMFTSESKNQTVKYTVSRIYYENLN
ncbi:MAG: hypothetical protein JXA46_16800 [Dehalococcoidales bacterium]|nr:hypothetical protein [Dehalococcoidales bacterium]